MGEINNNPESKEEGLKTPDATVKVIDDEASKIVTIDAEKQATEGAAKATEEATNAADEEAERKAKAKEMAEGIMAHLSALKGK